MRLPMSMGAAPLTKSTKNTDTIYLLMKANILKAASKTTFWYLGREILLQQKFLKIQNTWCIAGF